MDAAARRVGETLGAHRGGWNGDDIDFTYQWQSCTSTNTATCTGIVGATSNDYLVTSTDAARYLRVEVTAVNPHGSIAVMTGLIGPIVARAGSPLMGTVTDTAGVHPLGAADVYLWPSDLASQDEVDDTDDIVDFTQPKIGTASIDPLTGRFSVVPTVTQAVRNAAAANGGVVNVDIVVTTATKRAQYSVPLELVTPATSDPDYLAPAIGDPVPDIAFNLAPIAATPSGPPNCSAQMTRKGTEDNWAYVGEVHTWDEISETFTYGRDKESKSEFQVAAKDGNGAWSASGNGSYETNTKLSSEISVGSSGRGGGLAFRTKFRYTEYLVGYACNTRTGYQIRATSWRGSGQGVGTTWGDGNCVNYPSNRRSSFKYVTSFKRESHRAHWWGAGAGAFGVSFSVRSGFNERVAASWAFQNPSNTHWMCGNDNLPEYSTRVFAGFR